MTKKAATTAKQVDTSYLETLLGYNTRRVSIKVFDLFEKRMAAYNLSQVDFSILSLILHNPGMTSRQLCSVLNMLPPNLVSKITMMEERGVLAREPHPDDGRAIGLFLTDAGTKLMLEAEKTAAQLEQDAAKKLTATETKTLFRLLQKIYL